MKSQKSPVNYGKIIISLETLVELQYSPIGLILKPSTFRVFLIVILGVLQKRTQIMKQSHTVAATTNLLSSMNIVATTILPGIPLMVIAQTRATTKRTRSQTSLDSIQIAEKSYKELKDLAQQLLLQSEQLESIEKNSPASSEASVGYCPNNPLFQDSQDPYDGCNLDSDQTIQKLFGSGYHSLSLCMNSTRTQQSFQTKHYSSIAPVTVQ